MGIWEHLSVAGASLNRCFRGDEPLKVTAGVALLKGLYPGGLGDDLLSDLGP